MNNFSEGTAAIGDEPIEGKDTHLEEQDERGKLIIGDDDQSVCDFYVDVATSLGIPPADIIVSHSPDEVIVLLSVSKRVFAVITDLDYKHPDLSGMDVLRAALAKGISSMAMISGFGTQGSMEQAQQLGAIAIKKPFVSGELETFLNNAIARMKKALSELH